MNNHDLIQRRAEIVYELLDNQINNDGGFTPPDYFDGLKVSFALKTKSISLFKKAFRQSGTEFDILSVEATYEDFSEHMPGISGLMLDEKHIISELEEKLEQDSVIRL